LTILDDDLDFTDFRVPDLLVDGREIFADGVLYVDEGLILGLTLLPAAGQTGHPYADAFIGFLEYDLVLHLPTPAHG
jgi:hypothetical protein